jgi:predicted dehydrogenase
MPPLDAPEPVALQRLPGRGLRAGVAGTGFVGALHARSARLAGARLVGVAASTPQRGRDAAAALGAERGFDTAAELATSDDVDVLHVCTPNRLHAELAEAALRAGKHVVCEKPLATGADEAAGLARAAAETGRVATVPFAYRYHPVVFEARARVTAGELGALRLLHGGYLQDWLAGPADDNWRVDPEAGGPSRAFADIGSHWFDLAEFVCGERVASVCAQLATVIGERGGHPVGTEDLGTVLFRTAAGALGTMLVSQVSPGRKNHLHLEIAGERASLRFEQERPETLWIGTREAATEIWRDPGRLSPPAARVAITPAGHPQGYQECFDLFVADTYAAIGGEEPDGMPTFADGARSADVVDAVLRSAAQDGAWTDVAPAAAA